MSEQFDVYSTIANRLYKRHRINIMEHMTGGAKVLGNVALGINFTPKDRDTLASALLASSFEHDDRAKFVECVAASQTFGQGYREVGAPSLHFQLGKSFCNIHLDTFGFVAIGPDGTKYYNPDLVQHIVDELKWAEFAAWAAKKNGTLGKLAWRTHPILPTSANNYDPAIGLGFDVKKGGGWGLAIEATQGLSGEQKVMAKADIFTF